jgi:hypothetical protein
MSGGSTYGPYPASEVAQRMNEAADQLRAKGYTLSGGYSLLEQLLKTNPTNQARAALRLGWRREKSVVDSIVSMLSTAGGEVCSYLDALGLMGDPKAIEAIRPYAARKLLSRRRSASEALRALGDEEGLKAVRELIWNDRLPDSIRNVISKMDEANTETSAIEPLLLAIEAIPLKQRGLILDSLYDMGTPALVAAVCQALQQHTLGRTHFWRYAKSIYKRSILRNDARTFAILYHAIEAEGMHSKGTTAFVKSGFDGAQRNSPIFRKNTQGFCRRLGWRYLRKIAMYRPELYAKVAAEVLIAYTESDRRPASGFYGDMSHSYLFQRILFGKSSRHRFDSRTMKFRFINAKSAQQPSGIREENFPEQWDAYPLAYVRLLEDGQLEEVQSFAVAAIKRAHRHVVEGASSETILKMLQSFFAPTVMLATAELSRRFNPLAPDWALFELVVGDQREAVRALGLKWLKLAAGSWVRDLGKVVTFLSMGHGDVRSVACELLLQVLPQMTKDYRESLAKKLLEELKKPETNEGAHDGFGRLAREALAEEINPLLTLDELLALMETGSLAAKALAGELLGKRPEALEALGMNRILAMAEHQIAAIRAGAHQLLVMAIPQLRQQPSILFTLSESQWEDTRQCAFRLLRTEIDISSLGIDGLLGLCDSNRVDVQLVGQEILQQHFDKVDMQEVLFRLAEHPHPNMRTFTLKLLMEYLPVGVASLDRVNLFFRAAFFDLWPQRSTKRMLLGWLEQRGCQDAEQASYVSSLLNDFLRTATISDFENVIQALVRIQLKFPDIASELRVQGAQPAELV